MPKPNARLTQNKKTRLNQEQQRIQQPRTKFRSPDSNQIKEMMPNLEMLNMLELTNDNNDLENTTLNGEKKDQQMQKVKSP